MTQKGKWTEERRLTDSNGKKKRIERESAKGRKNKTTSRTHSLMYQKRENRKKNKERKRREYRESCRGGGSVGQEGNFLKGTPQNGHFMKKVAMSKGRR